MRSSPATQIGWGRAESLPEHEEQSEHKYRLLPLDTAGPWEFEHALKGLILTTVGPAHDGWWCEGA